VLSDARRLDLGEHRGIIADRRPHPRADNAHRKATRTLALGRQFAEGRVSADKYWFVSTGVFDRARLPLTARCCVQRVRKGATVGRGTEGNQDAAKMA
jgi:hypothetical protein